MNESLMLNFNPKISAEELNELADKIKALEVSNPTILFPVKETALPEIVDFDTIYQTSNDEKQEHIVSIMKFADGTQTKCVLDISEGTDNEADDYTAFLTCYCKKILGVDFHKTWRYWLEKRPNQEWKNWLKECEELKEQKMLEESRRKRRERKKFKRMVKQKEMELRAEIEAKNNINKK